MLPSRSSASTCIQFRELGFNRRIGYRSNFDGSAGLDGICYSGISSKCSGQCRLASLFRDERAAAAQLELAPLKESRTLSPSQAKRMRITVLKPLCRTKLRVRGIPQFVEPLALHRLLV